MSEEETIVTITKGTRDELLRTFKKQVAGLQASLETDDWDDLVSMVIMLLMSDVPVSRPMRGALLMILYAMIKRTAGIPSKEDAN